MSGTVFGFYEKYDFSAEADNEPNPVGWVYWEEPSGAGNCDGYVAASHDGKSKVLYMHDGAAWPAQCRWRHDGTYKFAKGVVEFDAHINIGGESTPPTERLQLGMDGDTSGPYVYLYDGGSIYRYNTVGAMVYVGAFTEGTWQHWKFEINMYTQSYDLYIAGSLVASSIPFHGTGTPKYWDSMQITSHFQTWGDHYFDNFEFSGEPTSGSMKMEGTIDDISFNEQIKVVGTTDDISFNEQVKMVGNTDDISLNEQIRMDGNLDWATLNEQVKIEGITNDIAYNEQVKVEGVTSAIDLNEQVKMEGDLDWIPHSEQIKMEGDTSAIDMSEQFRMEGDLDWVPHNDQMKVEGEITSITFAEQIRVDGITVLIPFTEQIEASGTIGFYHWNSIRVEGTVEFPFNSQVKAEGVVSLPFAEQVKVNGIVLTPYEHQIRVVGTVSSLPARHQIGNIGIVIDIPFSHEIKAEGTVYAYIRNQVMVEGYLDGEDYQHGIKNEGDLADTPFFKGVSAEGEIVLHPYNNQIKTEGDLSGIPNGNQIRNEGDIWVIGNFNDHIRVSGWFGDRPRRPPYDMRMQLDHFIRRMRGTVRLYHFRTAEGTYDHHEYVKPDPEIFDLTGFVFFVRNRHIRTETLKFGMADTYQGHLVIDTANLPDGLEGINEYHDIIEYNDPELGILNYRFKEHGISFEEWHGVVEYKLESMHPFRRYSLHCDQQIHCVGTVIGELYDKRIMMRGYVTLIHEHQMKMEGTIDYAHRIDNVEVTGIVSPFYVNDQMKMEGTISLLQYTHQIKVGGELTYAIHKHQMRMEGLPRIPFNEQIRMEGTVPNYWNQIKVEGNLAEIPHDEGIRVVGDCVELLILIDMQMIENQFFKNLKWKPRAFNSASPIMRNDVKKWKNWFGQGKYPQPIGHKTTKYNNYYLQIWRNYTR